MNKLLSTISSVIVGVFVLMAASANAQVEVNRVGLVEELKIIKSQSEQFFEDEAYLLKEALGNQLADSNMIGKKILIDAKPASCLMLESLPENIEIEIKLPDLSGKSDSLVSKVHTVVLKFEMDLKKHLPC